MEKPIIDLETIEEYNVFYNRYLAQEISLKLWQDYCDILLAEVMQKAEDALKKCS